MGEAVKLLIDPFAVNTSLLFMTLSCATLSQPRWQMLAQREKSELMPLDLSAPGAPFDRAGFS
jgi:hypothetical protein